MSVFNGRNCFFMTSRYLYLYLFTPVSSSKSCPPFLFCDIITVLVGISAENIIFWGKGSFRGLE